MTRELRASDEQLGQLARKYHDLFRRVRERSLEFEFADYGLQRLIAGEAAHFSKLRSATVCYRVGSEFDEVGRKANLQHGVVIQLLAAIPKNEIFARRVVLVQYGAPVREPANVRMDMQLNGWSPATPAEVLALCLSGSAYFSFGDVVFTPTRDSAFVAGDGTIVYWGFLHVGRPPKWEPILIRWCDGRWTDAETDQELSPTFVAIVP